MRPFFYKVLEIPAVYSLSQSLLAPGAQSLLGKRFQETFHDSLGLILDVGCGPRLATPKPREGVIVGIDLNRAYVERYAGSVESNPDLGKIESGRKVVGFVASADHLPFSDGVFDETRSNGLLHHLTPDQASKAVSEMCRCTRLGGRVVIFDAVMPRNPLLRPLAWALRKADRGEWVRREQDLLAIVQTACPGNWSRRRFTYSYYGLETICLILTKGLDL